MSEPIELYDAAGDVVTLYGPAYAAEQVAKGLLFDCPPLVVEEEASPPKRRARKTPSKEE